jgi:hypothetical protein
MAKFTRASMRRAALHGDFGGGGRALHVVVVRMRAEQHGEVAAGGEADDADAVAVDMPLSGVGAGQPHRLLRVLQVGGVVGIVALRRGCGTRYFTRRQVMPSELSHSQVSVPSPFQARRM